MSEQFCKCHCHNNHGLPPGSDIQCKCLPICKHCHPEAFPGQKREADDAILHDIAERFKYMEEESGSGVLHTYLAPLYLQLRILKELESIAASLSKKEEKPIGDVEFTQDGKRYKGIILSVEDDE